MFDLFRSRAKVVRIMLGGLLLMVALSLTTYLIPGGGLSPGAGGQVVAEFGKEVLSLPRVNQVVQQELRGQSIPPAMAAVFVPQIANQLITEHAVAFQAERMGFRVSEADLAKAIRRIFPQLFLGDQFVGRDQYAAALARQGMTIPQFEETLRKQLLVDALRRMVIESVTVPASEVEREFHARNDKLKIEYAALSPDSLKSEARVTQDEIRSHFERNRTGYQIPERRSFDLLIADETRLAATVTASEAELRRAYEQNKEAYRIPERVHVRHILLKTTEASKEDDPKIEARAQGLLKQLQGGADFAAIAKKDSQDEGSAPKGGDLSWIVRGQTVKAFEDAAFTLKPKQLSGVIKTEYGFHILQVLDKQDAHVRPFAEVRPELASDLNKQALLDRMQKVTDQARASLSKDPAGAQKIAGELGLQLIRADKLAPGDLIPGIGPSPELRDALALVRRGEVSPVVQISATALAVAVVTDVQPARQAELAEVEAQIRQEIQADRLRTLASERAGQLFEKAKSMGGDLRKAALEMGVRVRTSEEFTRDGNIDGLGPVNFILDAFQAPVGELRGPSAVNESQVVYKVVARVPADSAQLAAERDSLIEQLKNSRARTRVEIFEDNIRQQLIREGKIKVHQSVLDRLTSSY